MLVKDLIKKERKFASYEYQIKIKAEIKEEDIHKLGAERLGTVVHEDQYFIPKNKDVKDVKELIRIRREGGENLLFSYKGPVLDSNMRNRLVINRPINRQEAKTIRKEYQDIININKKREIYLLGPVVINLDKVENLGHFVDFVVKKKGDCDYIHFLIKKLGLEHKKPINESYLELALKNLSVFEKIFGKVHAKLGRFSYGISSAVLTTLGIVVAIDSSTSSKLAVFAGIIAMAIAGSMADALAMFSSKKAERGVSSRTALRTAMNTCAAEILVTLSFLVPFIIFSVYYALVVSIVWGLLLIIFVSILMAFIQEENIVKRISKNILLAVAIIVASYLAGKLLASITSL